MTHDVLFKILGAGIQSHQCTSPHECHTYTWSRSNLICVICLCACRPLLPSQYLCGVGDVSNIFNSHPVLYRFKIACRCLSSVSVADSPNHLPVKPKSWILKKFAGESWTTKHLARLRPPRPRPWQPPQVHSEPGVPDGLRKAGRLAMSSMTAPQKHKILIYIYIYIEQNAGIPKSKLDPTGVMSEFECTWRYSGCCLLITASRR